MKIEYVKIQEGSWDEVKDSALTTIHKKHTGKEISAEWKSKIIKSEHSPIRELIIRILVTDVPRWIADQIVRHNVGVTPYMGTMRPDRGGKSREDTPMTEPTILKLTMNAQSLINISQSRLCVGQVSKETRELWEDILKQVEILEPVLYFYCVPSCIYRCGCKEFKPCKHFEDFIEYIDADDTANAWDLLDIDDRYKEYYSYLMFKRGDFFEENKS